MCGPFDWFFLEDSEEEMDARVSAFVVLCDASPRGWLFPRLPETRRFKRKFTMTRAQNCSSIAKRKPHCGALCTGMDDYGLDMD